MKHFLYILSILTIFCFNGYTAEAFEIKIEPDISISENYISNQNMYLVGLRTWFNTSHQKDIVSVALEQTISNTIFGDVLLIGNKMNVVGEFFDDVRLLAHSVTVSGVTNKDLVIVAQNVVIEEGAILNGDTLILAHSVVLQGKVLGNSQITANIIDVGGNIIGNTTITGQKISFLSSAKILSPLSYFSPQKAQIQSGAQIQQELNFNQIESISQNDVLKKIFFGLVSFWAIIKLIATLFMIFVLTQVFKVFTQRIVEISQNNQLKIFIVGVLSFIVIPLLILILVVSLVLIPISLILGFVFGIMIILLPAISAIISASFYSKYILKKEKLCIDFNMAALALIVLTFVGFIPYIGSIVIYSLYLFSFGTISICLYEQIRRKKIKI